MRRGGRRNVTRRPPGTFDVDDKRRVKHSKIGVWDLYEERVSTKSLISSLPGVDIVENYLQVFQNVPYVWMMVKDIAGLRGCWWLLIMYILVEVVSSLIPALSLWCVYYKQCGLDPPS